jgi:hypothetical protein
MADPGGGRLDPKSWPGTDANAKDLEISTDDARRVMKALQADLDRYSNASHGTPDDIKGRGHIKDPKIYAGGMDDKTGYPAGRTLATFLGNAQSQIPAAYSNFLQSYDRVIQALGDMTGVYDKADDQAIENNRNAGNTPFFGNPADNA